MHDIQIQSNDLLHPCLNTAKDVSDEDVPGS